MLNKVSAVQSGSRSYTVVATPTHSCVTPRSSLDSIGMCQKMPQIGNAKSKQVERSRRYTVMAIAEVTYLIMCAKEALI